MKYIVFITTATLLFCLAIGFDISPFLRGPSPYPPEWRWPYFFVNTLNQIYPTLIITGFAIILFNFIEKKELFVKKHRRLFLLTVMILGYLFQLSILYFSRSGIGVLIHRIINPQLNGYFTASLTIHDFASFLRNYNNQVMHFIYHAKAHPPGAILLFYIINQFANLIPAVSKIANHFSPSHADVRQTWNMLLPNQKTGAVFAGFFIPFLSMLSIIPLYYSVLLISSERAAARSVFLFLFIPSLVFFIPINDAFLHIFSISSFYFFLKGLFNKSRSNYFLSGTILFLGVFFNLSLLPIVVFLVLYFLFFIYLRSSQRKDATGNTQRQKILADMLQAMSRGLFFLCGFLSIPAFLFFVFQFNFIQVTQTIMAHVPDIHTRSYRIWIFYNLYDFFVFSGIPTTLIFFLAIKNYFLFLSNKQLKLLPILSISFTLMLLILNFSGSVRGETGRLWSVYMPFMTLIAAAFLTDELRLPTKYFAVFLLLQVLQIVVMQEFWVMLW